MDPHPPTKDYIPSYDAPFRGLEEVQSSSSQRWFYFSSLGILGLYSRRRGSGVTDSTEARPRAQHFFFKSPEHANISIYGLGHRN